MYSRDEEKRGDEQIQGRSGGDDYGDREDYGLFDWPAIQIWSIK